MTTLDPGIVRLIEELSNHYKINIDNKHTRGLLYSLTLEKGDWDKIASLTEMSGNAAGHNISFTDLYDRICAMARFVSKAYSEALPQVRAMSSKKTGGGPDDLLRSMSMNNFKPNLDVLADLSNGLFEQTKEIDAAEHENTTPEFAGISDVQDIANMLRKRNS